MRIGIDISSATPQRTGIGTYAYEIARRVPPHFPEHNFSLMFNSLRQPLPDFALVPPENVQVRRTHFPGPVLLKMWQILDQPTVETFVGNVDVFHSPATYVPPQATGARVATVHDLSFFSPGADYSALGGGYLAWVCQTRLPLVDGIIVNSCCTRRALLEQLAKVKPGRDWEKIIHVTPLGVDERFFCGPEQHIHDVLHRYNLPSTYLLHVGTHEPRKNVPRLIRAYDALRKQVADTPHLVLAGSSAWREQELLDEISTLGLQGRVLMPGYIDHRDLPAIYRGATLFVYPSKLEGFGLPVLEAMAGGVPVIASKTVGLADSLDTGLIVTVDPESTEELTDAMRELLNSPASRESMIKAGQEVARKYSWDEVARQTVSVYEQCAAR